MKSRTFLCSLVLLIGLIWVTSSVFAADASDVAGRAAAWEKAYNSGDLKAVADLYEADGCRMPPFQATVKGRDAIMAQLKDGKDKGFAKVKIAVTSSETSGDMGYGIGTYEIMKADGSHLDHGKWMLISKKGKDGWKTTCDIFNSDMAMPAPPPAK